MSKIRVVATGDTKAARSNARGKLFEQIVGKVLSHHGYDISDHTLNINFAGMEIDVHGRNRISRLPIYAECKCYSSDIPADKLQTFFGKYMTQWFGNKKCQGLFVALPGVNSHALGFYRQYCENNQEVTVTLLQEDDVLKAIVNSGTVLSPQDIATKVDATIGRPGESELICTDQGFFWKQFIIPVGSGLPTHLQLLDAVGNLITDEETISYLSKLVPEIEEFNIVTNQIPSTTNPQDFIDEVVELRGSSTCFEYQFPAAPEFFVGRTELLSDVDKFITEILNNNTSSRSLLFEANSGWGKSSAVLATVDQLTDKGHFALAIDSRSASSSQFVLHSIDRALKKFGNFDGLIDEDFEISGFESAISALVSIGEELRTHGRLLCIFFDQFENVFYLQDVLAHIAKMCLKIADSGSNIVLGFSWKTDLVGLTREFPYRWRDMIIEKCHVFRVMPFSDQETDALLDRLSTELRSKIRRDLRFLLSEFSQGYPWLLKKLCAHVKAQRESGIMQADIARSLLNVGELFQTDLEGLAVEEESALRYIARIAPVNVEDLGEEFSPELIQSLVDRRLIVRVGTRYDVYWDIFRDYLNTGHLPVQELYILRAQVGTILKAISLLQNNGGTLTVEVFQSRVGTSMGTYLNIVRDLRLLQIATVESDQVTLTRSLAVSDTQEKSMQIIRDHVSDRLRKNRVVHTLLNKLDDQGELLLAQVAEILRRSFPFISAVEKTWETYARILCDWLDIAVLAVFDSRSRILAQFREGSEIRERQLVFSRRNQEVSLPTIQFAPLVQVASRLVTAVQSKELVDWSGIRRSTIYKSLANLEDMGLISRTAQTIIVNPECENFARDPQRRVQIAQQAIIEWSFFREFLEILKKNENTKVTQRDLGEELSRKCGLNWKPGTAETNAKICLDWARHLELAPLRFAHSQRGQFKKIHPEMLDLFEENSPIES